MQGRTNWSHLNQGQLPGCAGGTVWELGCGWSSELVARANLMLAEECETEGRGKNGGIWQHSRNTAITRAMSCMPHTDHSSVHATKPGGPGRPEGTSGTRRNRWDQKEPRGPGSTHEQNWKKHCAFMKCFAPNTYIFSGDSSYE